MAGKEYGSKDTPDGQQEGARRGMAMNDHDKNIPRRRNSALDDGMVHSSFEVLAPHTSKNEYAQLKGIIKQQGLLDKQPATTPTKSSSPWVCGL